MDHAEVGSQAGKGEEGGEEQDNDQVLHAVSNVERQLGIVRMTTPKE